MLPAERSPRTVFSWRPRHVAADAEGKLEVPLEVAEGRPAVMTLYPAPAGFGPEAEDAAAWIVAQALIALENARLHGQVQRQAVTDELTGLANRRSFLARLDAEVVRSRRSGSPLGIVPRRSRRLQARERHLRSRGGGHGAAELRRHRPLQLA